MSISFRGYEEKISTFVFRENGAITIPKSVREVAYSMAIDVFIKSVSKEQYSNFKTTPASGFYGYATLVRQDACSQKIALEQSRQRIFQERISEAYENWYALYLAYLAADNRIKEQENILVPIGQALGLSFAPASNLCIDSPPFQEVTLREVYVKCPYGTQFEIEVSYYKPVSVLYGDCQPSGKSQQIDGDKDFGLPENGVQPTKASNPSNPYGGLPPVSSPSELGAYLNGKEPSLNDPDLGFSNSPKNAKWVGVKHKEISGDGSCIFYDALLWAALPSGDEARTTFISDLGNQCGGRVTTIRVSSLPSGAIQFPILYCWNEYSLIYSDSNTKPEDVFDRLN